MKKIYKRNWEQYVLESQIPPNEELFKLLKGNNFEDKHFSLTFINNLPEPYYILVFIKNIIDNDTKIRELSSFRLSNFILDNPLYMKFVDENEEIILRAICDVNPQVCRNICNILHLSNKKSILLKKIINKIEELIENTKIIKIKSHKASKDIFNLYWNFMALESLIEKKFIQNKKQIKILLLLIKQSLEYRDYTIRERAAYVFKKLAIMGVENDEIKQKIQNDSNFYVKNSFLI